MITSLTGSDVFNTILMQRSLDSRLVILVESTEDCGLIDPHLDEAEVQTTPGFGKLNVLDAASRLHAAGVAEVIAVVDADFDRLTGIDRTYPPNVVLTEFYDLDADLFFHCPQAVSAVAANFSDRESRQKYLSNRSTTLHAAVLEFAVAIGEVRYSSRLRGHALRVRKLSVHEVVDDFEAGSIRIAVLSQAILRSPQRFGTPTASDVAADVSSINDGRLLASGHDLIAATAALCRSRWGGSASASTLASAFRGGAQCSGWKQTYLYEYVQNWAQSFGVVAWTCS